MSISAGKLSRENLRQVLASVGSWATDLPVPEHTAFDWHACRYFSTAQLTQLNNTLQPAGDVLAEVFAGFCHRGFTVTVKPVQQVSVSTLGQEVAQTETAGYALLLGHDLQEPCGAFWMPANTARLWAQWLMGDSSADEDTGLHLSSLEESLLCDLVAAYVAALRDIDPVFELQSEVKLVHGRLPAQWDPNRAFVKLVYEVTPSDAGHTSKAVLMLACSAVASLVGHVGQEVVPEDTDYSSLIMANMHGVPVSLTVRLRPVVLTLEELMGLRVDDVLVLEQRIDQGLEVLMDDKVVFHASPGKRRGKQAVVITECVTSSQ